MPVIHDTLNPAPHLHDGEIEQQPAGEFSSTQVGDELSPVNRMQLFHGLDFDDYCVGDDKVEAELHGNWMFPIFQREGHLPAKWNTPSSEFYGQTFQVCRLKQAWAEASVYLDGGANDGVGERIGSAVQPLDLLANVGVVAGRLVCHGADYAPD
jgi:hypothetical protein